MKIGIVGYGVMGRNHERIVASEDEHELIGIFDPKYSKNSSNLFKQNLDDLIQSGIEACILCVPPNQTKEHALTLASRKIPTLIEKPLSDSFSNALLITDAFEANSTFSTVGYVERFNQAVIKAKELLMAGELGKLLEISSVRLGYLGNRSPEVGVELDLLVHDLDLIYFLTGNKPRLAKGIKTSFFQKGVSDSATLTGSLEDDTHFTIRANWISPFKKREFSITGERGTLIINTSSMETKFYKNGTVESHWDELTSIRGFTQGDEVNFALTKIEPLKSQFESFIHGAQGGVVTSARLSEATLILGDIEKYFSGGI